MAQAKQLRWLTRAAAGGEARFDPFLVLQLDPERRIDDAALQAAYKSKLALLDEDVIVGLGVGDEGDVNDLRGVVEKAHDLLCNPLTRQACVACVQKASQKPASDKREKGGKNRDKKRGGAETNEETLLDEFADIIRAADKRRTLDMRRQTSQGGCSSSGRSSAATTPLASPLTPSHASPSAGAWQGLGGAPGTPPDIAPQAANDAKAVRAERRKQRKTQLRALQERQKERNKAVKGEWFDDDSSATPVSRGAGRGTPVDSPLANTFPASPDIVPHAGGTSPGIPLEAAHASSGSLAADLASCELARLATGKAFWKGVKLHEVCGAGGIQPGNAVQAAAAEDAAGAADADADDAAAEAPEEVYISYPGPRVGTAAPYRGSPPAEAPLPARGGVTSPAHAGGEPGRTILGYLQDEGRAAPAARDEPPPAPTLGRRVLNGAAGLGGAAMLRPAIVAGALCGTSVTIAKDMTRNRNHLGDLPPPDMLGLLLIEAYGLGQVSEGTQKLVADPATAPPAVQGSGVRRQPSKDGVVRAKSATPVQKTATTPTAAAAAAKKNPNATAEDDVEEDETVGSDVEVIQVGEGSSEGKDSNSAGDADADAEQSEVVWIPRASEGDGEGDGEGDDGEAAAKPVKITPAVLRARAEERLRSGRAAELDVVQFIPPAAGDAVGRGPQQDELRLKSGCIAQTALWVIPALLRRHKRTTLEIKGQVDAGSLPCFAISDGYCRLVKLVGGHAELEVTKRRGGPINNVTIRVHPIAQRHADDDDDDARCRTGDFSPLNLTESGVLSSLDISVWVSRSIPLAKGQAAAQAALTHLQTKSGDPAIAELATNTHLHLWKEDQVHNATLVVFVSLKSSLGGVWNGWSIGGSGTKSEHTGIRAAAAVLADFSRGGCISDYLQEHAATLMAAAPVGSTSRVRLNNPLTHELETTMRALKNVRPEARFTTVRPPTHSMNGKHSVILECRVGETAG